VFRVGGGGGSSVGPPPDRQAGIPADDGRQLRRFPRALRLDDLLADPDDEPRREDSPTQETSKETPPSERELLTIKQLVAYSTLSERTLRGYVHRLVQPLPHYQVDKKILVRRSTFDEWLAQFRHGDRGDEIAQVVDEIFSGLTMPRPRANTRAHPKRRG